MKNRLMEKRYLLILFVILVAISYNIIQKNKQNSINNYIQERTTFLGTEYNTIYAENKKFADLIFNTILNKPILLKQFKNRRRGSLLNKIQEDYNELKTFNIQELHFYLPNNHSFLRVHKPFEYGDNLSMKRKMLRYLNIDKKRVDGFEVSSTSDAFRFIYPLYLHTQYIGSVEIAFSSLSFIDKIKSHFDVEGKLFIKKQIIDGKLFTNKEKHYRDSTLPQYYTKITKEENTKESKDVKDVKTDKSTTVKPTHKESKTELISKKQLDKLITKIEKGEAFSQYSDKELALKTYIPIKDPLNEEIIAFYLFTTSNLFIKEENYLSTVLFLTSVFIIAVILFLIHHELKYRAKLQVEVEDRTLKLQKLNMKLENLVTTDTLTGIYNRDYFYNVAMKMLSISKREKKNLSIAVINIDQFKEINDTHGHTIGDKVLISLVDTINDLIRDSDVFVRFTGDEFVLLLPGTDLNNAYIISEKIRKSMVGLNVADKVSFTISIGVAELSNHSEDVETILKKADVALYRAKSEGRDCTVLSSN